MTEAAVCPFHPDERKTVQPAQAGAAPAPVSVDGQGTVHVHDFELAREVLRSEAVRQAGFMAETVAQVSILKNQPVLYLEGEPHHEMRRQTARYFTPATVAGYRRMMERLADDLVGELVGKGRADLDDLSLRLAVQVAAQVVGLTDSLVPGMAARIGAFVEGGGDSDPSRPAAAGGRLSELRNQAQTLAFYLLDVQPAIRARRRTPREDVISHVLGKGYSGLEVLTECVTYGTAGMVTTREFICAAAWHLLERPALRQEYVHASERERHALLHEILRLEPVVQTLYRRAASDLELGGLPVPAGALIALHLPQANTDAGTVGQDPAALCPHRPLPKGVQAPVLSFGDGHHRCPGAYLAIQETDIFLRRLLWLRDLRMVQPPKVTWNETIKGYELRAFTLAVGAPA